jgi:hypothetical protein
MFRLNPNIEADKRYRLQDARYGIFTFRILECGFWIEKK